MDKLHDYQGWTGRFHEIKERVRARHAAWRETRGGGGGAGAGGTGSGLGAYLRESIRTPNQRQDAEGNVDFSHIYRYACGAAAFIGLN